MERKRTYSTDEVAEILGVNEATVRKRIHAGELKAIRFGRRILIPLSALEAIGADVDNNGGSPSPTSPKPVKKIDPYDEFEKEMIARRLIPGVNTKIADTLRAFEEFRESGEIEPALKKLEGKR